MKIANIQAFPVTVDQPDVQRTAQGDYKRISILVVRVETDNGLVGWGEGLARRASRSHAALVEDVLVPLLLGADPFAVEAHSQRMLRVLTGKSGGVLIEAIAAVDIALWDLMGKALDVPVYQLLGHMGRSAITAYASSVGWDDDASATVQARGAVDLGFTAIKVKLGAPVADAARRAGLIRDVVGPDIRLMADANWIYDVDDAVTVGRMLEELAYDWFEEPIVPEDLRGYCMLRDTLDIRLAAGESEYTASGASEILASRAIGIVQPDVARSGGITETRRIAMLAHAHHIAYAPHIGFSGAICVAASLHLAAAMPNFATFECMIFDNPLRDQLVKSPPGDRRSVRNGHVAPPTGPGLGIEVDEAFVREMSAVRD